MSDITIFFEWEPPVGRGPEYLIEYYELSVTSTNDSAIAFSVVSYTFWNVTLNYNLDYEASVVSVNCAGRSEPVELTTVYFSKFSY